MKKYLCLDYKKTKKEAKIGTSCFYGDPDFSQEMILNYDEKEMFIAQINLEEVRNVINSVYLPKSGILYFFYNIETKEGKVLFNDNIENLSRIDFNEDLNLKINFHKKYLIKFNMRYTHHDLMFLYENDRLPGIKLDEVILLKYYFPKFDYNKKDKSYLYYVISKEDLINRRYDQVRTIIRHK